MIKLVEFVVKCIVLISIIIVLTLSYWAYLSDYSANKEALLDKNLLIATTNEELDVREALVRQNFADKDEWRLAYRMAITPPLGQPLSQSELSICQLVIDYEEGRGPSLKLYELDLLMPFRFIFGAIKGQLRGGSTALSSAVGGWIWIPHKKDHEWVATAALSTLSVETKCRVIISALQGSVVKNGKHYQRIRGAYALSEVIFKRPLHDLSFCEQAFLASSFRKPLSSISKERDTNEFVYNYHIRDTIGCPTFNEFEGKLIGLDIQDHPLFQNLKYKDTPLNIPLGDLDAFNTKLYKAQSQLEKRLNSSGLIFEVVIKKNDEIISFNSLNKQGFLFGKNSTAASVSKLLIAKAALSQGAPTNDTDLTSMLCHSDAVAAKKLYMRHKDAIHKQAKLFHLKGDNGNLVALTTEQNGWSTDNVLQFSDALVEELKKHKKVPNAFGQGCTAYSLLEHIRPRYAFFAKTGTAFENNKVKAKLLLFALKAKDDRAIIILIRLEGGDYAKGICSGSGCIKTSDFKYFLIPTLDMVDQYFI